MALRVAVLTDTLSPGFFFPIWCRYYGDLFGRENLHVISYEGIPKIDGSGLGSVIRLPIPWDDGTRAALFSDLVTFMLGAYDVVIRTDTDEILVVDPAVAPDLRSYLQTMEGSHCTARGFDVVQTVSEAALEPGPILAQRRFAYPNTALNKTCIVRTPVRWSPGFHWCTRPPQAGAVFLLHLKRVDVAWELRWHQEMLGRIGDNPKVPQYTRDHYSFDHEKVLKHNLFVSLLPRLTGIESWYREDLQLEFIASVQVEAGTGLQVGAYRLDEVLCAIPDAWRGLV